ncbi:MAG TPA: rhodanese-like domain-containing protein [Candidatus Binatia bacterium]|nr:rhodanese-like domain-containing protein [Candidatus Binatia bacterium]
MPKIVFRDEVQHWIGQGARLVEVLPEKQYREIHLPGAVNIPLQKLDEETTSRLSREQPVIVYCYDFQ